MPQNSGNIHCALVLTYFLLTKGRVTIFQYETTVVSFMHLMLLICKMFTKHFWKHQFEKKKKLLIAFGEKWLLGSLTEENKLKAVES